MESISFKDLWKLLADLFLVNLLFWFTLIVGLSFTLTASLKAMFHVVFHLLDRKRQTYVIKEYFASFKESFWVSFGMSIAILLIALLYYFVFNYAASTSNIILTVSLIVSAFLAVSYLMYLIPVFAIFQTDTPKEMFKNSFFLFAGHPLVTLKLASSLALIVLLFELFSGTILFSIAIAAVLNLVHLKKVFKPYLPIETKEEPL